jgi:hypothetical protein
MKKVQYVRSISNELNDKKKDAVLSAFSIFFTCINEQEFPAIVPQKAP